MTTNKHPYPSHVVEAVAKGLYEDSGLEAPWEQIKHTESLERVGYYEYAEAALKALWGASRIDHPGQVESIPGDAILTTPDSRAVSAQTMQWVVRPADYPAHVIYWGDHDDR